jgi:Ni/Co efflux regulator RcnB
MKKLVTLLAAALFALTLAVPASAAPADDSLAIVPATKAAKATKSQKHKTVKKAKHKRVRAHKRHR